MDQDQEKPQVHEKNQDKEQERFMTTNLLSINTEKQIQRVEISSEDTEKKIPRLETKSEERDRDQEIRINKRMKS